MMQLVFENPNGTVKVSNPCMPPLKDESEKSYLLRALAYRKRLEWMRISAVLMNRGVMPGTDLYNTAMRKCKVLKFIGFFEKAELETMYDYREAWEIDHDKGCVKCNIDAAVQLKLEKMDREVQKKREALLAEGRDAIVIDDQVTLSRVRAQIMRLDNAVPKMRDDIMAANKIDALRKINVEEYTR